MFDLVIPKGVYHRANGNLPPFELVNMLLEQTPSAKGGFSLLSFPGLMTSTTVGMGPINGVYRQSDLFGGATFAVSGTTLYKDGIPLGAIDGSGPVSWASSDIELVVTRGASAWSYNGTDLVAISFPDGANVIAVTFIAGLFVFARADSQKFYWSAVLDARTIDALDFASAESAADHLLDIAAVGDALYLAGKDSIEVWVPTGDSTLPFQRISLRTTTMGVAATGSMCLLDNALHFIGSDRVVYRMEEVPTRISNHGIEEQLSNSSSFATFPFQWQGHPILMLRLSSASYGYDVVTGEWHERRSNGSNWRVQCAIQQADGTPLFGSTGADFLVHSGWSDEGSFSREFTAAIPLEDAQALSEVEIEANIGAADLAVPNPLIEMRSSRDGGKTWGPFRRASLGATGKYRTRPRWRRLGMFDAPGALFHFRVTDAVPFRVSGADGDHGSSGRER